MRALGTVALGLLASVSLMGKVNAADFDGSKPFVCALLQLTSCERGSDCEAETPESVNVPRFLFIDAAKSSIAGTRPSGKSLTAAIGRRQTLGDLLVLDGAEDALSWTVTVNRTTGDMSLGVVGEKIGFVVFGECTPGSKN
jgi:hypothetical protein